MTSVPDVTHYCTRSTRIGAVDLKVVRVPRGTTPLDGPAPAAHRIRLLAPVDDAVVVRISNGTPFAVGTRELAWLPRRGATVAATRATSLCVADMPSEELERQGFRFSGLPPRSHPGSPIVRPVREFLVSAAENAREVGPLSARLFEQMLVEMIESLMLEARGMPWSRATSGDALHAQAVAHITAFRSSTDLTPQEVADALRVSLRQLQRAFAAAGSSVAAEIRAQRADAALAMLHDSAFDVLKMPDLAARAGFANDDELRRAVLARAGVTPGEVRRRRRGFGNIGAAR